MARILSVVLVAVCAGGLGAGETPKLAAYHALGAPAPSKDALRGYQHLFEGNLDAALASFTKATEKAKEDPAAFYALGLHALNNNEHQKGLELLCRAFTIGRNSPWGELYLAEIAGVLPYCRDPQPFISMANAAAEDAGMRPHLRDLARARLGDWLMDRGEFSAAIEINKPLNYITQWCLSGPFDNRDGAGLAANYEPESGIDYEKTLPGRNRRVGWTRVNLQPYNGRIDLDNVFEPRIHVAAYAVTHVKAEAAGWAVLRAGCAGVLRVWVNEKEAGAMDAYNDYGEDKLAVLVYLHKGWNQILIKSGVVEETDWAFSMRLCRPEGGAAPGLTVENSPEALAAYKAEPKDRPAAEAVPAADLGLVARVAEALKQDPENIWLLAGGAYLQDIHSLGRKEEPQAPRQLAKAIALAPRCAYLRLLLADITEDNNEARQAVEAARELQPGMPRVCEKLADLAHQAHLHVIAEEYAQAARSRFGEKACDSIWILAEILGAGSDSDASARTASGDGRKGEAWRLLSGYVERHPYQAQAWARLVALENSQARRRAVLQKALGHCGGDARLRGMWAEELSELGREDEAAEFRAAALKTRPFAMGAILGVAQQYRRAGKLTDAVRVLEEARQWAPENPDLLSALGMAQHQAGRTQEALQLYREVLRLKPNSPQIKDYVSQLDEGRGADRTFYAPYDIALKDLPMPKEGAYPDDNVVNLLNQEVVRVNPNGSASRMIHTVVKVLRQAGIQESSRHQIYYEPERQVVDILRAAVITPEGREIARAEVRDRSTSAAMGVQTRIYDQHHMKMVVFKDLEPGSIVDLQYTIRDSGDNIYGDYFADTFHLSDDQPTVKSQYVLDYPKNLAIQTRVFNAETAGQRLENPDTRREVVKWELGNTPGVIRERAMPPFANQVAQLQVTTMNSWQEVGQWYWNLAKDQFAVTDEMRKDIAESIQDCKTDTDKLRAVHDWAIRKIRYLGIEFGRNGYKPHKSSDTYKSLYGDCKDTSTLISAMLKSIGIDSRLVLIRTVDAGAIPADSLPMPNLFNHCIAYVPNVDGKAYWIDGTTDYHCLGEVPYSDQGAQVLVASPEGGKFVQVTPSAPGENQVNQKYIVKVDKSGAATFSLYDTRSGQFAPAYRQLAETPGQYERYMKEFAAKRFNGAKVLKLKMSGPGDQGPVWMETEFEHPSMAIQSGDRKALLSVFEPFELSSRYATEARRVHDLEFYYGWGRKLTIAYQLDKDLKIAALPQEVTLTEPFCKYMRTVKQDGATVTISEEFELSEHRIPAAQYEKFRACCNKIDSLQDQKILIEGK